MKRKITALVMACLVLGSITDLIAYASNVWIKGQWSTDLEVVLPEEPLSVASGISFTSTPDPTALAVDDIGDEPEQTEDTEEPSTPPDISLTTDGAASEESADSSVFVIVAVEPEDRIPSDEEVNVTPAADNESPVDATTSYEKEKMAEETTAEAEQQQQ